MKDLVKKTDTDLQKLLIEKRKALFNFRIGVAGSKIKNVKERVNLKHEVAQILTEAKKRSLKGTEEK